MVQHGYALVQGDELHLLTKVGKGLGFRASRV